MTTQGQFGGLSLPEVEEDAWSVKDYIEWKRNQVDWAFDLKKTQWHPMTWKRHNKKDTINNSSDTQCHLEKTHWLGRTSSWRLQKHKMTHKHTRGRQKLLDNDSIKTYWKSVKVLFWNRQKGLISETQIYCEKKHRQETKKSSKDNTGHQYQTHIYTIRGMDYFDFIYNSMNFYYADF